MPNPFLTPRTATPWASYQAHGNEPFLCFMPGPGHPPDCLPGELPDLSNIKVTCESMGWEVEQVPATFTVHSRYGNT